MENNELYHFGIHGMKWGVRRYQNEDGSRTEEGKIHYGYKFTRSDGSSETPKSRKQIRLEKREARKAKKEAKRIAKEEKKREQHEAELRRVIKNGTAEEVMRFSKELSVEQKNEAVRRLQADSQLLNIANQEAERNARIAEKNSKWNKFRKTAQRVGEAGQIAENLAKTYNTAAKYVNAFSDTHWPLIGEQAKQNTRSMQLAKQVVSEYGDYSYNEWKNMDQGKVEDLKAINARIAQLAAAEKLAKGSGGKSK